STLERSPPWSPDRGRSRFSTTAPHSRQAHQPTGQALAQLLHIRWKTSLGRVCIKSPSSTGVSCCIVDSYAPLTGPLASADCVIHHNPAGHTLLIRGGPCPDPHDGPVAG